MTIITGILALLHTVGETSIAYGDNNKCGSGLSKAAYDKGIKNGEAYAKELANDASRLDQYKQKIQKISPDVARSTGDGTVEEIAFCSALGYVDGIINGGVNINKDSQNEMAKNFINYFSDKAKDKVCSSLRGGSYSAYCSEKNVSNTGAQKIFENVDTLEVNLVGGNVSVKIDDSAKNVTLRTLSTTTNAEIVSSGSGGNIKIDESIAGRTLGGQTNVELSIPSGVRIKIKTVSGKIDFKGTPKEVRLDAVSGDIKAAFEKSSIEGIATIASVRGNVFVTLPNDFGYKGKVKSVNGSVHGKVNINENALYTLRLGSVSGDIFIQ